MNRLTVKINGIEYALKGDEKEEYLLKLSSYVDKKLKSIMDVNPRLDTVSAAVLTAVNTIDEIFKQRQAFDQISKEKEELIIQLAKAEKHNEKLTDKLKSSGNVVESDIKEEIIKKLKESLQRHIKETNELKDINKVMKFQNQSAKYKILDLEQKLMNSQIDVAKTKKQKFDMNNNPLNKIKPL